MRKLLLFIIVSSISCFSQNWATVTASNITDLNQQVLAAGRLCFLGTDQNDTPINFAVGGGGQVLARPYCANISNGVATSFTVPNPAHTSPANIYYRVTAIDSSTGQTVLRYTRVAFTGTSFSFDTYSPSSPGFVGPPFVGSVTGPFTVNGDLIVTGNITGTVGALTIGSLTISSITGSVQCLQVNTSGQVSGTGTACGAGGGGGGAVTSITGTANQIIASSSTGAITLSTPQDIATGSSPQFLLLKLGGADTGLSRGAAGNVFVGNGTAGNSSGTLTATSLVQAADSSRLQAAGVELASNKVLSFSSTTLSSGTVDTGISRDSAGNIDFGNGTALDKSGQALAAIFANGSDASRLNAAGLFAASNKVIGFSSTTLSGGTVDAALSRDGANSIDCGNGTASNATCLFRAGYVYASGNTAPTVATQGAYFSWNKTNGGGETDLINNKGGGSGGWNFYEDSLTTPVASISPAGVLTVTGCTGCGGATSIIGTANEIIASASTGAVTLSTPQPIATTSAVQFGSIGLGGANRGTDLLDLTQTGVGEGIRVGTYLELGNTLFNNDPFIGINARLSTSSTGTSTNGFTPVFSDATSRTMGVLIANAADATLRYKTATYTAGTEVNINSFTDRLIVDASSGLVTSPVGFLVNNSGSYEFKDTSANIAQFAAQGDNNFVFYSTDGTGASRAVWNVVMHSSSSALQVSPTLEALGVVQVGATDTGLSRVAAATLALGNGTAGNISGTFEADTIVNGADAARLNSTGIKLGSGKVVAFSSTTLSSGSVDTGLSRDSAGVIDVGNGTASDKTGILKAGGILTNHGNSILDNTQVNNVDLSPTSNVGSWSRSFRVVSVPGSAGTDGGAFGALGSGTTPTYVFMAIPTTSPVGFDSTKIVGVKNDGTFFINATDTGLSRDSAGVIDVGNGTAGNASGSLRVGASVTTTSSNSTLIVSDGTRTGQLAIATTAGSYSDFSAIGDTVLRANTASLILTARDTSSILFGTGTADTAKWSILNNGTFSGGNNLVFGWSSGGCCTAPDTGLSRDAAGTIDVGNGTAGNTSGTIKADTFIESTGLTGKLSSTGLTMGAFAVRWTGTDANGTVDTGLSRAAAGVIYVGNGVAGNLSGTIQAATHNASDGVSHDSIMSAQVFSESSTGVIGFASNTVASGNAIDSAFSRISAGILALGNGTAGSAVGRLRAATFDYWDGSQVAAEMGADANGSIELGPVNSASIARTPFIDFHWHDTTVTQNGQDFNTRLVNSANNELDVQSAAANIKFRIADAGGVLQFSSDTSLSRAGSPGQIAVGNGTAGDTSGLLDATSYFVVGDIARMDTGGLELANNKPIAWSSSSVASGVHDAGLSRDSAGVIDAGNGTVGDRSGTLRAATFFVDGAATPLALPTSTAQMLLTVGGGATSPISATTYFGDGTGWQWRLASRSASITTNLMGFLDTGVFGWFSGTTLDTGLSRNAAGVINAGNGSTLDSSGTFKAAVFLQQADTSRINSLGFEAALNRAYTWSSTTVSSGGVDTGLSRIAANIVGIGNGTVGNVSGTLQLAQILTTNATGGLQIQQNGGTVAGTSCNLFSVANQNTAWELCSDTSGNLGVNANLTLNSSGILKWNGDTGLTRNSAGVVNVGNGTALDSSGTLKAAIVVQQADTSRINSSGFEAALNRAYTFSSTTVSSGTIDTGISKDSPGVIDIGNGTVGDTSGSIKAATANFSGAITVGSCTGCDSGDALVRRKVIIFRLGSDQAPTAIQITDDEAGVFYNDFSSTLLLSTVRCISDTGAPTIQLQKDDGTPTNMLTADLTCGTGAGGSTSAFVAGENSIAVGNRINYLTMNDGTGTTKRLTVVMTGDLQ